jgi:hypothetical protein
VINTGKGKWNSKISLNGPKLAHWAEIILADRSRPHTAQPIKAHRHSLMGLEFIGRGSSPINRCGMISSVRSWWTAHISRAQNKLCPDHDSAPQRPWLCHHGWSHQRRVREFLIHVWPTMHLVMAALREPTGRRRWGSSFDYDKQGSRGEADKGSGCALTCGTFIRERSFLCFSSGGKTKAVSTMTSMCEAKIRALSTMSSFAATPRVHVGTLLAGQNQVADLEAAQVDLRGVGGFGSVAGTGSLHTKGAVRCSDIILTKISSQCSVLGLVFWIFCSDFGKDFRNFEVFLILPSFYC